MTIRTIITRLTGQAPARQPDHLQIAQDKRRLERIAHQAGCSRTVAKHIVRQYFADRAGSGPLPN